MRNLQKPVLLAFSGILFTLISCHSRNTDPPKFIEPSPRGYSQSVEYNFENTKMIFISGQVAVNKHGEIVGTNDLGKQTQQVFQNMQALVKKSGGSMKDIVKIEAYFTDLSNIDEFRKVIGKYFDPGTPPSCTVVQVERLVNEAFLIEISAVAIVKN